MKNSRSHCVRADVEFNWKLSKKNEPSWSQKTKAVGRSQFVLKTPDSLLFLHFLYSFKMTLFHTLCSWCMCMRIVQCTAMLMNLRMMLIEFITERCVFCLAIRFFFSCPQSCATYAASSYWLCPTMCISFHGKWRNSISTL